MRHLTAAMSFQWVCETVLIIMRMRPRLRVDSWAVSQEVAYSKTLPPPSCLGAPHWHERKKVLSLFSECLRDKPAFRVLVSQKSEYSLALSHHMLFEIQGVLFSSVDCRGEIWQSCKLFTHTTILFSFYGPGEYRAGAHQHTFPETSGLGFSTDMLSSKSNV